MLPTLVADSIWGDASAPDIWCEGGGIYLIVRAWIPMLHRVPSNAPWLFSNYVTSGKSFNISGPSFTLLLKMQENNNF